MRLTFLKTIIITIILINKKEIISEAKKTNKKIVKHNLKAKVSGAWKKASKTLSKIKNVASYAGKLFGVGDLITSGANLYKTINDKKASTWKKIGAGLKVAASIASFFIKATPLGFALSLGISLFTSWW